VSDAREPRHRPRPDLRADLGLVLVTAIWGLTFPAIRSAMTGGASPLAFVAARFVIAAALMAPLALRGVRREGRAMLGPAAGLGLLLGSSYAFQTIGLTTTTAANSGFITGSSVVMVPFLDAVIRRRRPSPAALLGAGVALIGLYLLSGIDDPRALADGRPGDLWTLACAAGYALYIVLLQDHLGRFDHWPFLFLQLLIVALAAAVTAPLVEEVELALEPGVLGALAFCAVFATVGTGLLQFRFQGRSSPVRTALIFSLEPVFAAGFAVLLLAEVPGPDARLGGALVVLGVLVADVVPAWWARRPRA
jgi:drug/metabolite transporter (DMT)-like permease